MTQIDFISAAQTLKKLTFSKSWQNSFVTKTKKLLNRETNQFEERELDVFVFLPAPIIIRHFGSDKAFLVFRSENKSEKDWDYKLLADVTENNNRRLAVWYLSKMLDVLNIGFTIDDSYTVYINDGELKKLGESDIPEIKAFYNSLYIPKTTLAKKHGDHESWS
jgi:hypothetical protein